MVHLLRWVGAVRRVNPMIAGGIAVGVSTAIGVSIIAALVGSPVPRVYDEFAYLLAGETFASGTATNPTHAHWRHFETFEVIHQPSYQAKYPPAQGLLLSLGIRAGNPILGVYLSAVMMGLSVWWALLAFLPARWALYSALLLTLQLGAASYWSHSYWGGTVAAIGGALLLGGTARIVGGSRPLKAGLSAGAGAAILANSRPLEGAVLALVMCGWVGFRCVTRRLSWRRCIIAASGGLYLVVVGLFGLGYYNSEVTGDPLTLPYRVYENTYDQAPFLLLPSAPVAPTLDSEGVAAGPELHSRGGWARYERLTSKGWSVVPRRAPALLWSITGVSAILLVIGASSLRRPHRGPVVLSVASVGLVVLLTPAAHPHYFAPATAAAYVLVGFGAKALRSYPAVLGCLTLAALVAPLSQLKGLLEVAGDWAYQRAAIQETLEQTPDSDLVFVHYPEGFSLRQEWVYNSADIDAAEVVWARVLGPGPDTQLIAYFSGRRVWDLHVAPPIKLSERSPSSLSDELDDANRSGP